MQYPSDAVNNTLQSIQINASGKKGASASYATVSYFNVGFYYYKSLLEYNKALLFFDTTILFGNRFSNYEKFIILSRLYRGNIYYKKGDYEKDIEETSLGLSIAEKLKDTANIISLLLERAQSLIMRQKNTLALNDVNTSLLLLNGLNNYFDNWSNALSYKADILAQQGNCKEAFNLYKQAIVYRQKVDPKQAAIDYNDAGLMLFNNCKNISLAKQYFSIAYNTGLKLNYNFACALSAYNIGELNFSLLNYNQALDNYKEALQFLFPHLKLTNGLVNPSHKDFLTLNSKNNVENLLNDKSKCLLYLYKQTGDYDFLKASIKTALLNDSIITDLRHEQSGEQIKLFWRNETRDFFIRTLEACYLDKNAPFAFHFMEKSRAVLLNDKLNELGADVHLPGKVMVQIEKFEDDITAQQQKLNLLQDSTNLYSTQLNKLLQTKENFDRFIKSLEANYPAYYQYKYADDVPSLQQLQSYLKQNNQSFVYYFTGDTVTYILAITSSSTKFIRLNQKDFNKEQLAQFLQLCANKEMLMNHYDSFASLSNSIYKIIFQPLQLPKGRIIICNDNIVIPFDALCTDGNGKNFLVNDYSFSYAYSAHFLMKPFINSKASGNFVGFAPVSFAPYLGVQSLINASDALQASAKAYQNDKLFTHQNATKNNFLNYCASYSVVSVFSHARADTGENEPVLFMQDSVIHLSELQSLKNPATQLVLLSACQTNVGKAATGEGIYSLARGFATAGIPSVAATLWKADEQTIYNISKDFNQYLAEGMTKDVALQKAKLNFIQNNSNNNKLLPYYWANMIVIGNTEAVKLESTKTNMYVWMIAACILICVAAIIFLNRKKLWFTK